MATGTLGSGDGLAHRLRQRRLSLGLSQSELAGADLSASYVSLLEAGKRTPTPEVLVALADRLQSTVGYLLEGIDPNEREKARLTLEYAELAIRNGEAADALSELTSVMSENVGLDSELRWRARRLRARALEVVGRLEDALTELERLRLEASSTGRYTDELQLAVDLVRCYQEVGDVNLAIDIGRSTAERLSALNLVGSDEHARLVSALIGAYYERGDNTRAAMLAKQAIEQIEASGSNQARAAIYWNASLTTEATGDVAGALVLAERAVALLSELDETRSLGRLRTAFGWLLLRLSPPDLERAFQELRIARQALLDTGSKVDLAYCATEMARCELMSGHSEEALAHTSAARDYLGDSPRVESAHARLVEGRALLALGRTDDALTSYRVASELLATLGIPRQGAQAWRELGDAYEELGLLAEAAACYRQALTNLGVRPEPRSNVTRPIVRASSAAT